MPVDVSRRPYHCLSNSHQHVNHCQYLLVIWSIKSGKPQEITSWLWLVLSWCLNPNSHRYSSQLATSELHTLPCWCSRLHPTSCRSCFDESILALTTVKHCEPTYARQHDIRHKTCGGTTPRQAMTAMIWPLQVVKPPTYQSGPPWPWSPSWSPCQSSSTRIPGQQQTKMASLAQRRSRNTELVQDPAGYLGTRITRDHLTVAIRAWCATSFSSYVFAPWIAHYLLQGSKNHQQALGFDQQTLTLPGTFWSSTLPYCCLDLSIINNHHLAASATTFTTVHQHVRFLCACCFWLLIRIIHVHIHVRSLLLTVTAACMLFFKLHESFNLQTQPEQLAACILETMCFMYMRHHRYACM